MKKILRFLSLALSLFIGLSSIFGGYGLISTNGLGMPPSWLDGSPFSSYIIPGLILLLIVGGTHLIAFFFQLRKSSKEFLFTEIAGLGLAIWITAELYIMKQPHWLQILYYGFAILEIVIAYLEMQLIYKENISSTKI